jgi:catechol 2,3-dioxygenase-like lactoylglutathione lyase family enzyme
MHLPSGPALMILLAPLVLWAVLFVLAEYGHVTLKPLKPWLVAACWVLYGAAVLGFFLDGPWQSVFFAAYWAAGLLLAWLKRRYLFESNRKPTQSLASVMAVPQPTYVAVRDVAAASSWYAEKFGLRKLAATEQARPDGIALQFDERTHPVILIPKDPKVSGPVPVFFTRQVGKVRDRLSAKGVSTGPVQQDRQGTSFFELLDGEGNTLEVSEQP